MKEKKQIFILSISIIILMSILIMYPFAKIKIKQKYKKLLNENVNKVINEVDKYYLSTREFKEEYKVFTIENWNIVEEGLIIESKLPQKGKIYLSKNGQIQIIANDKEWCITKKYDNDDILIEETDNCKIKQSVKFAGINVSLAHEIDGIYKEDNGNYYFKGENPNNYLIIDDTVYRIVSIDDNGYIKIIINEPLTKMTWSKYKQNLKIISFEDNTVSFYLNASEDTNKLRNNRNFVENEYKKYIYKKDERIEEQLFYSTISLLNVNEYLNTTKNKKCKETISESKLCAPLNWLKAKYDYFTIDSRSNSNLIIRNNGEIESAIENEQFYVRPVFTLNKDVLFKGYGTIENPYQIVIK